MRGEEPSGLFPAGPQRPAYREPHPVRPLAVLAGLGAGAGWVLLFTLLGQDLAGHVAGAAVASSLAWAAALVLARAGDRGVAVGVALAAGAGWAVIAGLVALYWMVTGSFSLW